MHDPFEPVPDPRRQGKRGRRGGRRRKTARAKGPSRHRPRRARSAQRHSADSLAGFVGGADRKTPKRDRPDAGSTGQRGTIGERCRGTKPHERRPTGLGFGRVSSLTRMIRAPGGAGGARRTRGARGSETPRGRSRAIRGGARQAVQDADRAPGEIRNSATARASARQKTWGRPKPTRPREHDDAG